MARFATAYTRPDGTSPHWGDADNGRALPFGMQPMDDHRYLAGLIGLTFRDDELISADGATAARSRGISAWTRCAARHRRPAGTSRAFPTAASISCAIRAIMSSSTADRSGLPASAATGTTMHCRSRPGWTACTLIVDPGSFVYTASFDDRNAFRSTATHNTPQVDGEEINRFHAPDNLWNLHEDAKPECLAFEPGIERCRFAGRHHGYQRLASQVVVTREIRLDHTRNELVIADELTGNGTHRVSIPLHLAGGVEARIDNRGCVVLTAAASVSC